MAGTVRVGISGWRYAPWRGVFYPAGLPQRAELEHASRAITTIEVNGSFYSLQRPASWQAWHDQTPDGFVFAVKGGRFITHLKKLAAVEVPLANFFAQGLLALDDKLGPLLWQLPPTLGLDVGRLEHFFDLLPRTTLEAAELAQGHDERLDGRAVTEALADRPLRHCLEVRHASFESPELLPLLRRQDIGLVVADTAGRWPMILQATTDLVYVRLHGDEELYTSGYSDAALDRWAGRVRGWAEQGHDVHVYLDNDVKVRAPFDAIALAERLADLLPYRPSPPGGLE